MGRAWPSPYTAATAAGLGLWIRVQCRGPRCTHEAQIDPAELVARGHGDVSLRAVEKRLICRACGHAGASLELID